MKCFLGNDPLCADWDKTRDCCRFTILNLDNQTCVLKHIYFILDELLEEIRDGKRELDKIRGETPRSITQANGDEKGRDDARKENVVNDETPARESREGQVNSGGEEIVAAVKLSPRVESVAGQGAGKY